MFEERIRGPSSGEVSQIERGRYSLLHQELIGGLRDVSQVCEPYAVGEQVTGLVSHPERKPRFSYTTDSDQGQQARSF
jgi:hypothetical protein